MRAAACLLYTDDGLRKKPRVNIFASYYFVGFSIKITQNPFYRTGDHSTMASDNKAMHRSSKEVDYWKTELNPIVRLR